MTVTTSSSSLPIWPHCTGA